MTEDPRISEIRAVVAEVDAIHPLDFRSIPSVGSVVDRIRAILDRPAPDSKTEWRCARCSADRWVGWRAGPEHEGYPRKAQCVPCGHVQDLPKDPSPAPQVFFPGDTVPRGVATVVPPAPGDMTRDVVYVTPEATWAYTATHMVVELPLPSVDDTRAAIEQAQAARADAQWQHTEGTTP